MTLPQAMTAPLSGMDEWALNEARAVIGEVKRVRRKAYFDRLPPGCRFEQFDRETLRAFVPLNRRLDDMLVEDLRRHQTPVRERMQQKR